MKRDVPAGGILAFDIGGTRIKSAVVLGATTHSFTTVPTEPDDLLGTVIRLGQGRMGDRGALPLRSSVTGIGLCVKGIVDPEQGVLVDVNEVLASWIGQPLAEKLGCELGLPCVMENDARMYALGELIHGAGRGSENMVCLTLGTGVGSGVALHGRVLRGTRGTAGILAGHVTVQVDGPRCTCGNIGCLEALIGTAGLIRAARETLAGGHASVLRRADLEPRHIFEAAAEGDEPAQELVQRFARHLAAGVVTLIHAYDPDIVVLGGGLAARSEQFLPFVQEYVDAHAWTVPRGRVRVVPAVLGDSAALVGIADLMRNPDRVL